MNSQLEGAWQLLAYQYSDATDFTNTQNEPSIHRKYITGHHFVWVTYDRQTNQLQAAAGGVCMFDDNTYSETPQYGLGQSFAAVRDRQHSFTYMLQGERWMITGTLQLNEPEPDTLKIVEIWDRI